MKEKLLIISSTISSVFLGSFIYLTEIGGGRGGKSQMKSKVLILKNYRVNKYLMDKFLVPSIYFIKNRP